MKGEFHIHTTASDGVLEVEEVLEYVSGKEEYIAITDHDILDNSYKAKAIASRYNLKAVVGVEVSTYNNHENVHILGYFNDNSDTREIEEVLKVIRVNRVKRLYLIRDKLIEYFNIEIDVDRLLKLSTITRGSIGREIVRKYPEYSIEDVFDTMIGVDSPAYVPSTKISSKEAIDLIHRCNGKAVLAHPTLLKKNDPEEIIKLGVDGIEARYPLNKEGQEEEYRALADKYHLFVSGGSDFHAHNDHRHGELLSTTIEDEDLERFLKEVL
ncbi:MAG: PHP domain-containing protein [Bacilli bacterium]|nr:PHP domain-containing protein [Bacilli bacterium]